VTLRLITDVTEPPAERAAVALDPEVFEELFHYAGGMLAVLDSEGRFLAVNDACQRVLGCAPETLVGHSLLDFVHPHEPTLTLHPATAADPEATLASREDRAVELLARHRHADGSWRWLLWSGAAHADRWYASARDVTEWIHLEDRVGRDPLTSLPNREVFTAELTRALARHERSNRHLAVLFIDIDSFKQINDSIGHAAGDRLLAQVAERLRGAVRGGDVVGRLGGDEFVILAESLEDEAEAGIVARRARAAFERPVELGSGAISISGSIGVTTSNGRGTTADELIHEADIAMYRAKAAGPNRFAIFDAAVRAEVRKRLEVERELRAALAHQEFALYYQPVVSLRDGTVIGAEALIRWHHPERGVVGPVDFVSLAERNGLIVPIGSWVLRQAAAQAAAWHANAAPLLVSVNVSPRQLADPDFVRSVYAALDVTGLDPRGLCLEVTETAVLADPEKAAARLGALREFGIRIAFDDFGTGYSSLRHLIQMPVDVIKLDRTFVNGLDGNDAAPSRAILIAVTAAARELNISVVAEGVEHKRQLDELLAAGCDSAQGNLFSPAVPAAEFSLEPHATPAERRKAIASGSTSRFLSAD
jgi:diguanylate cyclase (GGDEF)-like protein/PAS domain S-box-containing protein